MTIIEAIAETDSLINNTYSQEDKVKWLSRLDWSIKTEIIDVHHGSDGAAFSGYGPGTDVHTTLLVPPPFDGIYIHWLEAQIHYYNGENSRYNEAIVMYNTAFDSYSDHYKRTHQPRGTGCRFIF